MKPQHSRKPVKRSRNRVMDLPPPCDLSRLEHGFAQWDRAEDFICEAFAKFYGARIREVPATLMAVQNMHGQITAVSGLRYGANEDFFLEQYLDLPVEDYLRSVDSVDRSRIVEIANLTAPTPGHVRYMMIALTTYLHSAGYEWVVFTAIGSLCNSLSQMHLSPIILGRADPARLGRAAADWGSYYDMNPQVIAGQLADASRVLTENISQPESPMHQLWHSASILGQQHRIAGYDHLITTERKPGLLVVNA